MILKQTSSAIALAVLFLGISAAVAYARGIDLLGPDAVRRTLPVIIGIVLAAYSNLMPKGLGRQRASAEAMAIDQAARRVGGWSMTLAGLAYAALWAFAPIAIAGTAGLVIVASALLITIAYGWRACRPNRQPPIGVEGHG